MYELRPELKWFANEMERVLRENDHKRGIATYLLFNRLVKETYELNTALNDVNTLKPSLSPLVLREKGIKETVGVANYAMMIAKRLRTKDEMS